LSALAGGLQPKDCDVYRFKGDKVAELTAFVIRTDQAQAHVQAAREVDLAV
jgi:hypothetical protein